MIKPRSKPISRHVGEQPVFHKDWEQMAKRRTLTSEVEFGKIRKQIVDSFKTQLRGLMGCEAGCSLRSRSCALLRPIASGGLPRLDGVNELPGCHPRALPSLPELDHTHGRVNHEYQPSKCAYQYVVESADSASKSPQ